MTFLPVLLFWHSVFCNSYGYMDKYFSKQRQTKPWDFDDSNLLHEPRFSTCSLLYFGAVFIFVLLKCVWRFSDFYVLNHNSRSCSGCVIDFTLYLFIFIFICTHSHSPASTHPHAQKDTPQRPTSRPHPVGIWQVLWIWVMPLPPSSPALAAPPPV